MVDDHLEIATAQDVQPLLAQLRDEGAIVPPLVSEDRSQPTDDSAATRSPMSEEGKHPANVDVSMAGAVRMDSPASRSSFLLRHPHIQLHAKPCSTDEEHCMVCITFRDPLEPGRVGRYVLAATKDEGGDIPVFQVEMGPSTRLVVEARGEA